MQILFNLTLNIDAIAVLALSLLLILALFILVAIPIILIKRRKVYVSGVRQDAKKILSKDGQLEKMAYNVASAIGEWENINSIEPSLSKIKFGLFDVNRISAEQLKALGATGVVESSNSVTVIFGSVSKELGEEMIKIRG